MSKDDQSFTEVRTSNPSSPRPEEARYYWQRSDAVADQQRRMLFTLHTGGVAALFAIFAWFHTKNASIDWFIWSVIPGWPVIPGFFLLLGIFSTGVSLYLAKNRAIERAKSAQKGCDPPNFACYYHSRPYEIISFILFFLAVGTAAYLLPKIPSPQQPTATPLCCPAITPGG